MNIEFFKRIKINDHKKLQKGIFAFLLAGSIMPAAGCQINEDTLEVYYLSHQNTLALFNPLDWNKNVETVEIISNNEKNSYSRFEMGIDEFNKLLENDEDNIVLQNENSTAIVKKEDLEKAALIGENLHNADSSGIEIAKLLITSVEAGVVILIIDYTLRSSIKKTREIKK